MKRQLLAGVWTILALHILAQDCPIELGSPIKHKTVLSGSYGEPRSRHFHAGIDYKQYRGVPRDTIYAAADGYVSRIQVQPDGYGNALYLNHDCNISTVYAHLYDFAPEIRSYINDTLYAHKVYEINHHVPLQRLPVKRGQYIGIMGNTGRSSGPHLHFEVRKTDKDTPVNPALYGLKPKDNIPPSIVGIMIYGLTPDDEEASKQFYWAKQGQGHSYQLHSDPIIVDHYKVGIGIRTYDQMNGAKNHNGIYSLEMRVDGRLAHKFQMDSIPFAQAKYIHTHMDYEAKVNKQYVTKCFVNPINQLEIYQTQKEDGLLYPFAFRKSNVEIIVKDVEGNEAKINFAIQRSERASLGLVRDTSSIRVTPTDSLWIALGESKLRIRPGTFCQPETFRFKPSTRDSIFLEQEEQVPTFRSFQILHHYPNRRLDKRKYFFSSTNDKYEQTQYHTKWINDTTMMTYVGGLYDYIIAVDTIAPQMSIGHLPTRDDPTFTCSIKDNYIASHQKDRIRFEVLVNGQWQLAEFDAKTDRLSFELLDKGLFQIEVKAKDQAGNVSSILRTVDLR